jgi:hypothetical protein
LKLDLNLAWRYINEVAFDDELNPAKIHAFRGTLWGPDRDQVLVGAYHIDSGEILLHTGSWVDEHDGGVLEALYHEMVHQYIEEVLLDQESSPHGKVYREVYNEGLEKICRKVTKK